MNFNNIPKKTFPLTQNQAAIWLDHVLSENQADYVIGGYAEIKSNLNVAAFQDALRKVIAETDAMGIGIQTKEGTLVQVIRPQLHYEPSYLDLSDNPTPEYSALTWIKKRLEIPFADGQAPLFEFALLKIGDSHFFWMVKAHHVLIDTWGLSLFFNKLDQYYRHYAAGLPAPNGRRPPSFTDYLSEEQAYQNSEARAADRDYWLEKFEQLPPLLLEKQKALADAPAILEKTWLIPQGLNTAMEALAKEQNVSLSQLWMGVLAAYFYKITRKETLCFGLPVANRNGWEEKNTVGLFTGVVPLLLQVSAELSFEELLRQIKRTRRSDRPRQRFSFGELANEIRRRHSSSQSLFDISINIDAVVCRLESLRAEFIWCKRGAERKQPMTVFLKPSEEHKTLELKLAFLPAYGAEAGAERMLQRLETLIEEVVRNPKQTLQTINMLPDAERWLILKGFNDTQADFPTDKTIIDLFSEQAERTPENVALVFKDKEITYRRLHKISDRIAHYLVEEYGIRPGDVVGLQVERSEWIVIGLLGILKAGAAYLPIGPDLPKARAAFMLEDSAAKLLLTDQTGLEISKSFENIVPVLALEHIAGRSSSTVFRYPFLAPHNLAYIIYTSGSTGQPKGVMIEHRNVVRLMVNDRPLFDFNENDVWTLFHYYGFDFSVWEIWGALLFGGKLVVVPKPATLNPEAFAQLLTDEQVTVLNQVPATFEQVQARLLKKAPDKIKIRYIIFGGAKLNPVTLHEWKKQFPDTRLINMYGITETTVHVTYKEIGPEEIQAGVSNVGKAIPTLRCYILDESLNPVPIGVAGEIYVAGEGLARGYLNQPELTAARFIDNPFEPGERLYRSGDSGRRLENGDMEFFGRLDFQLKIRGFRIEAGEIEQRLLEHPAIHSAVVMGRTINGDAELVAYLAGEKLPSLESLRAYLAKSLPEYMIPAYFVPLAAFPLTQNGKIDRKTLPKPEGLGLASNVELAAPRNATETKIVAAFAEILGLNTSNISIYNDFFLLGGDSIKLIRLVGRINRELGVQLPLDKAYALSRSADLSDFILQNKEILAAEQSAYNRLKQEIEARLSALKQAFLSREEQQNAANMADVYPMSDIQKGMVFGNMLYENQGVYHDQAVYALGHIGFEKARFEQALQLMADKHENLRTVFRLDQVGEDLQVVFKSISLPLSYHETQTFHRDELELELAGFLESERKKGFDLENGPLWRMKIFQADAGRPLLVFQFHHGIFDGWSLASFNTELLQVYHELQSDPDYKPAKLSLSYRDFIIREQIVKQDETIRAFWKQELEAYERTDLFTDEQTDDEFEINLGTGYIKKLEALADDYEVSVKILALSAYLLLLGRLTAQSELTIGVISNNRLPEESGDKLLGCFLNSVPLRMALDKQIPIASFIRQVKDKIESLRGADRLSTLEIARLLGDNSMEGNPIFDVIFNYIDFHIYQDLDDIGLSVEKMMQPGLKNIPTFFERTNTWFDLMVNTTGNELRLKVQLSRKLKTLYSSREAVYKYLRILDAMIEAPEEETAAIPFLNEAERRQLLHTFNDTATAYPENKTIIDLFEEQAVKTPDRTAVVYDGTAFSYREIEQRSRQLACYLSTRGVKADTLVGVSMEHSVEMIVAILGILRAGGAYVPLDPGYPKDRLVHMIEEGLAAGNAGNSANIILTQAHLKPVLAEHTAGTGVAIVALAEQWQENAEMVNLEGELLHKPSPEDLIYVIFTSGSTGKPKGTLVKHQGFFNLMHWYLNDYNFHAGSRFLLVSSINFDLTQKNFYAPLLSGGSLHLCSAENYDLAAINRAIQEQQITNINCTPTIFYGFVDQAAAGDFESLRSLEYVFLGGEPINLHKLDRWFNNPRNKAQLINSYGPTECSDVVSAYTIKSSSLHAIPIGKPICNTQIYILDEQERLVPLGVQGELCISGKGVGRGYLNNPELTGQKFVPHPFRSGELLYKTGDMARMAPDGNIEFLGRADHQLKIRGYRIEAGEIETILSQHPSIRSAVVAGKEIAGNKELAAYIVASEGGLPSLEILHKHLSQQLPAYMIPACFIRMDALPLTPSGKINKLALPEPEENSLAAGNLYVAPRTRTEAALVRIWEEVLGRSPIGVYDDFFALGGHSLRVIRLVSLIQQRLAVSVKLSEVFAQPTIAALAAQIATKVRIDLAPIQPAAVQEHYALSNAQRRLWVLDQMDDEQVAYNMPTAIRIQGAIDVEALQFAVDKLVARHEILRANIITADGVPRQIFHSRKPIEIGVASWQAEEGEVLSDYILNFARRPFDLATDNLFRLELLRLGEEQNLLLFNMHHIISDGWSMEIMLRELSRLYNAYVEEEAPKLPALRIQYKDYAAWQNALLEQSELMEDLRNYWRQKLAPAEDGFPILELPADYPRPAVQSYRGATLSKTISLEILASLEALSRASGVTLYMVLIALVKALLYRYSGQRDIIAGSLSAGRNHPDMEAQLGFYVNTLALRNYIADGMSFAEFLVQVKQTALEAIEHESYPFDRLVEELDLNRDTSRAPLFDVLIAIQNEESPVVKFGDVGATLEMIDWKVSKFDLSFGFTPTNQGLLVDIEYCTDLYKAARIGRMFEHLEYLIQSVLADPGQPVEKLNILPQAERRVLLEDFGFIPADYKLDKTVYQLFEEQVERTPENIAVVFEDKETSYRVLNERANVLAHYLRDNYKLKGDDVVALQVDRSDWMIVALLGTMKSGAAYLPIAPDSPRNRTEYLLRDSGARVLLTDRATCESARAFEARLPVVAVENVQHANTNNPSLIINSRNLAYVIYTSGSTGRPKGVMVEHRSVVNMLYGQLERLEISAEDRTLQFAPYTFDASVGELYLGVSAGAMMVVARRETLLSADAFRELMYRHRITIADVPPSYLTVLDEEALSNVRMLITGGEAAVSKDVKKYSSRLQYVNIYGPTETTVVAASFMIPASYEVGQNVPIGRPVPNMEILIVDEHLQVVPIGIPGQIAISGIGLARGYLNNESLTREKFVSHPFREGERLYLTGDRGRWLEDGLIEFLGRIDRQLKIKGYRIEAGEIEAALVRHPAVKSCVVAVKNIESRKELIAYIVAEEERTLSIPALRLFLGENLPDYMIPAYFIELEAIPLTSHDKVDRKALPEPDFAGMSAGKDYAAPRNEMERLLAQTWAEVLRRPRIGINDNFFHIGGDSIKALQISGRLGAQGWAVSIKDLFTQPTIARLASKVTAKKKDYPQEMLSGKVPLGAAQKWFFECIQSAPHHFNQSFFLSSRKRLDADLLRQSLEALLWRHDLLRAFYMEKEGTPVQFIRKEIDLDFQVVVIEKEADESFVEAHWVDRAQAGFDLQQGGLLKAVLFQKPSGDELFLTIHHLVVDGVSWRILLEDLNRAYQQLEAGTAIRLAPKTAPFGWWTKAAATYAASPAGQAHFDYWEQLLTLPADPLQVDFPEQSNRLGDSVPIWIRLDQKQTQQLLQQTHQAYHTEINDLLLCALSRALYSVFGGQAYQVTLEGHGREALFDMDVSRTVGWFTAMFPIVLDYEKDPGYHLQRVKEHLRRIPNKGLDYAMLRYLSDASFSRRENSVITFNYLGAFSAGEEEDPLTFSDKDVRLAISPDLERDAELDVSGVLMDGRLQLSFTYGARRMARRKTEALAENMKEELLGLIAHCAEQEKPRHTPSDFTACDLSLRQYQAFLDANGLPSAEIEDVYNLSPLQEGMLFHKLMNPGSPAYFNRFEFDLPMAVNVNHFKYCWEQLLKAHPALRTSFFSDGLPRPLQVVWREAPLNFVYQDVAGRRRSEQEQLIEAYRAADRAQGFTLKEKSLLRVALFRTGTGRFKLFVSDHHIVTDGWSQAILMQDLKNLYQDKEHTIAVRPFSPYIKWLNKQSQSEAETFWKQYLDGYEGRAELPQWKRASSTGIIDAAVEILELSPEQTQALEQLAHAGQVSLNTVIQGIWAIILGIYNQQDEVIFGIATSGRSAPIDGVEQISGLFINTIPLRVATPAEESFWELISRIQRSALEIQEYEHYSLAQIQKLWGGQGRLVDHILVFENYPADERDNALKLIPAGGYEPVDYDFGLVIGPGERMQVRLNYNAAVWPLEEIRRIKGHIATAIDSVLTKPEQPLGLINILPQAERRLVLHEFNGPKIDFPLDKTIIQLFERQTEQHPGHVALVFEGGEYTYRQLNEQANRIAHYLRSTYAIKPDDIIALQLERSQWMFPAILGAMKAGAAYLPIGADFPKARVAYMLKDSKAVVLLTDRRTQEKAKAFESLLPVVNVEEIRYPVTRNPDTFTFSRNLAYVIYTSGSTGRPKGTLMEHRGAVNMALDSIRRYDISPQDRILQFATYTFDPSLAEFLMAFLSGAALVLVDKATILSPATFQDFIKREAITVASMTPEFLKAFKQRELGRLRLLITGGEPPRKEDALHYRRSLRYINEYGPTECSVCVCAFEVPREGDLPFPVPIGKPIANTQVLILDKNGRPAPVGVPGELCIGGVGLARAYLNHPERTAEKFIPHPVKERERIYKTGDLARWTPDGNVEFFGRMDDQLKIRGHRVEVGEIERALLANPDVYGAVVIGRQDSQAQELAAYLVAQPGRNLPDVAALRAFLLESLPEYMIPVYFMKIERLPLNASGKVDRKQLPQLKAKNLNSGVGYLAPRDAVERQLAEIWEEVLDIKDAGVYDNFFHLGGHSLRAIRLSAQIQERMGARFPIQLLYRRPTLAEQAEYLSDLDSFNNAESHKQGLQFNPDATPTVFAFPPFFGLGVWYQQLAAQLPRASFYCFDFIPSEDRLGLYYQEIKNEQAEGPYTFFGYSAGGVLALKMAAFMESKGERVAAVILGDSHIVTGETKMDIDLYLDDLETTLTGRADGLAKGLLELLRHDRPRRQSRERLAAYQEFLHEFRLDAIQADIYLIQAETAEQANIDVWKAYTNGRFYAFSASGTHDHLFLPPNLEINAGLLDTIFRQSRLVNKETPIHIL